MTFFVTPTLLNKELGQVLTGMFRGESGSPYDPFVSPLYAGLAGLPRPKLGP